MQHDHPLSRLVDPPLIVCCKRAPAFLSEGQLMPRVDVESIASLIHGHCAIIPDVVFAAVILKGRDALDLLHRISTNDLRRLTPGVPVRTVFTTEKGRIIDWVEVVLLGSMTCLVAHRAAEAALRNWINRYIILEDVELSGVTHSYHVCSLICSHVVSSARFDTSGMSQSISGQWDSTFGPFQMRRYLIASQAQGTVEGAMETAGFRRMSASEYTALRVAAGIPSCPEELNGEHNPLEGGLRDSVSFSKGCYIGQEVIARLDSHDKVQRELVVMAVSAGDAEIASGADINASPGVIGSVTSQGGSIGDSEEVMVMGYVLKGTAHCTGPLTVLTTGGPKAAAVIEASGRSGIFGSIRA